MEEKKKVMHVGGPLESDEGGIVGTLFIVNVENRAAAIAFTEHEPFHRAGVFESVLVRRWRQMQPEMVPGANATTAEEGRNQLKEEGQDKTPLKMTIRGAFASALPQPE